MSQWLFLRILGVIYLVAFISLWTQLHGLIGSQGIAPIEELMELGRTRLGPERYWLLPTLCWFSTSDLFLHVLCACGVVASLLLIVDLAPALMLAVLWGLYLSLATVCDVFLHFQWDILLLEMGLLAIVFAPWRLWPRRPSGEALPSTTVLWLLRWLLFRLMFASGWVKLSSGDPTWRDLTALTYHYETQPLPTWIGWYAHQLPAWIHEASAASMFVIELVVPFLIFAPRRVRLAACVVLVWFQVLISVTGNYGFFNLLTIALCLVLVDDAIVARGLPRRVAQGFRAPQPRRAEPWIKRIAVVALAAFVLSVSVPRMAAMILPPRRVPKVLWTLVRWASPLRSVNGYGLFAVMTTSRPEIIIEGSQDGETWRPYEFRWKPGDVNRPPAFVQPHMPRLDWQMWFAALSDYRNSPWFLRFAERLLEGSPPVLALLEKNPFPEAPPRYIRATVYDYHFTSLRSRRIHGAWWRREPKGFYCPVLALREPDAG